MGREEVRRQIEKSALAQGVLEVLDSEGKVIGKVKAEEPLPPGGMSVVLSGKSIDESTDSDLDPESDIAMKFFAPQDIGGVYKDLEERFKREASQHIKLDHINIVKARYAGTVKFKPDTPSESQEEPYDPTHVAGSSKVVDRVTEPTDAHGTTEPAADNTEGSIDDIQELTADISEETIEDALELNDGIVATDEEVDKLEMYVETVINDDSDNQNGDNSTGTLEARVIVMDLIKKKNLFEIQTPQGKKKKYSDRIMTPYFVEVIARQLVEGGKYLHDKGIVHRDMKPDNMMVNTEDILKILDLGIHKSLQNQVTITQEGIFMGTVAFAAPEQFDDLPETDKDNLQKKTVEEKVEEKKPIDHYLWGATLYSLLLRTKDDPKATLYYKVFDTVRGAPAAMMTIVGDPDIDPVWPCDRRLELHPSIEALVMTLIEKGEIKQEDERRNTEMRETFDGSALRLDRIIKQKRYNHPQIDKPVYEDFEGVKQTLIVWKGPDEWISKWEEAKKSIPNLKNTDNYDSLDKYVNDWLDILDKAPRRLREAGKTPITMTSWDKLNESIKLKLMGEEDNTEPVWPQSQELADKERAIVQDKIKHIDQAIKGIASYVISHISQEDNVALSEADAGLKDKGEWFVNYLRREQHFLARYAKKAFPGKKIYRGMNVTLDERMDDLMKRSKTNVDVKEETLELLELDEVLPEASDDTLEEELDALSESPDVLQENMPVEEIAEQSVTSKFEEQEPYAQLPTPITSVNPAGVPDISDALKEVKGAMADYDNYDITGIKSAKGAYRILADAADEVDVIIKSKPKLAARYYESLKEAKEEIKYWDALGRIEENLEYLMGLHGKATDTKGIADLNTAGKMFKTMELMVDAIRVRKPKLAADYDNAYESYKILDQEIKDLEIKKRQESSASDTQE